MLLNGTPKTVNKGTVVVARIHKGPLCSTQLHQIDSLYVN